jgi:NhaA family Na+:H+ antiporter
MPIFALSNAGIDLSGDIITQFTSPVALGIFLGLVLGKVIGVFGLSYLMVRLKWVSLPLGMNNLHLLGAAFLAAIGFTMSLFISGLAFTDPVFQEQAKFGILIASILSGVVGFLVIRKANKISEQNQIKL